MAKAHYTGVLSGLYGIMVRGLVDLISELLPIANMGLSTAAPAPTRPKSMRQKMPTRQCTACGSGALLCLVGRSMA